MDVPQGREAITWSPRLRKEQLAKLYRSEAEGYYDERLIEDVGSSLYMRCRDIMTVKKARGERLVRCPVCDRHGKDTFIRRTGSREELLRCAQCGWEVIWREYLLAVQRKQLNPGGAVCAFERFIATWERNPSPREKMLAIDRLIHEFHHSWHPDRSLPTRPVGCNLIKGRMSDIIPFLDALTAGETTVSPENAGRWRQELESFRSIDWSSLSAAERERQKARRRGQTKGGKR